MDFIEDAQLHGSVWKVFLKTILKNSFWKLFLKIVLYDVL